MGIYKHSEDPLDSPVVEAIYVPGKNLFDKNNFQDLVGRYIGGSGLLRASTGSVNDYTAVIRIAPNTTYTVSKVAQSVDNRFRVGISSSEMSVGGQFSIWDGGDTSTSVTLTSAQDSAYMYIYYALGDGNKAQALSTMQVEVGSVPTSYEPYPRVLRVYHGTDLVYGSSTDSQGSGQNSGADTIIAGGEV